MRSVSLCRRKRAELVFRIGREAKELVTERVEFVVKVLGDPMIDDEEKTPFFAGFSYWGQSRWLNWLRNVKNRKVK